MLRQATLLLIHGLLPVIPALLFIGLQPDATTITPWPMVIGLLIINLLIVVVGWRWIADTRRQRQSEAMMLLVLAFFPLATYYSLFPSDGTPYSLLMQVLIYCLGQIVWTLSVETGPEWIGRIRQRRAEERALSGKEKFASREEVLKARKKES